MDDQSYYQQQLELAREMAQHGLRKPSLQICFNLRVHTDLSLYTRALVNMTLADLTDLKEHPDKLKYAEEALQLARELLEDRNGENDAYWSQTYTNLVAKAERKVTSILAEQARTKQSASIEAGSRDMSLAEPEVKVDQNQEVKEQGADAMAGNNWIFVPSLEDDVPDHTPVFEGIFTTRVSGTGGGSRDSNGLLNSGSSDTPRPDTIKPSDPTSSHGPEC